MSKIQIVSLLFSQFLAYVIAAFLAWNLAWPAMLSEIGVENRIFVLMFWLMFSAFSTALFTAILERRKVQFEKEVYDQDHS